MTTTMTMKAITSVLFLISLLVSLQADLFRASKHAPALPQAAVASCKQQPESQRAVIRLGSAETTCL